MPDPRPIYVASRASLEERPAMWRALRASGVAISSTWIDAPAAGNSGADRALWSRIDDEIAASSALVFYARPEDFPFRGALVEIGMAIGRGIPVRIVLDGVEVDEASCRPIGSWIHHPLVTLCDTVEDAVMDLARMGVMPASRP